MKLRHAVSTLGLGAMLLVSTDALAWTVQDYCGPSGVYIRGGTCRIYIDGQMVYNAQAPVLSGGPDSCQQMYDEAVVNYCDQHPGSGEWPGWIYYEESWCGGGWYQEWRLSYGASYSEPLTCW